MAIYLRRIVNLEQRDYWIIRRAAEEKGLGDKGFSAALRLILREWDAGQPRPSAPSSLVPPERRASDPPAGQPPSTAG